MLPSALESIAGFVIVVLTLADVFSTVLALGSTNSHLRIAGRVREMTLPLWLYVSRTRGALAGVGLFHVSSGSFSPPLGGFNEALYVWRSSLQESGT